jgi:hypothetical protein
LPSNKIPDIIKQIFSVIFGRSMTLPLSLTNDQLAARRQLDQARDKHRERKRDNRRKIIAGAVTLSHAASDPNFRRALRLVLQEHLTRPSDRALFADLLLDG